MITVESINKMSDDAVMALSIRMQSILEKQEQTGSLANELEEAKQLGITDGKKPKAFCTRAQAAIMVKRAVKVLIEEMKSLHGRG